MVSPCAVLPLVAPGNEPSELRCMFLWTTGAKANLVGLRSEKGPANCKEWPFLLSENFIYVLDPILILTIENLLKSIKPAQEQIKIPAGKP